MKTASCLTLATILVSSLQAADWPNFRGPHHDGISRETGWTTSWPDEVPKTLWRAKVGIGFAGVSVANGKAYTTGNAQNQDTVFCFDANTGAEIWKHTYAAPLDAKYYEGGTSASPTVDGNRVFTVSKRGIVHCLDAANGKVIWTKNLQEELDAKIPEWGFAGSVFISGDLAILNIGSAGTALDKNTGKVVWKTGAEESGYSTPFPIQVGGEPAVLMTLKQHVAAIRIKDGKEFWRFPWKTQYDVNAADPIQSGNLVFISSGYNRGAGVFDVSANPPTKVWENKNMRNHMASSVLWEGHLYGVDENQLRCVEFATGEVKWTERASGKGALILADGKLIVISERGELMIAPPSPAGFNPVARAQVVGGKCWTAPTLSHGKLYVRTSAGDLVCLDLRG
jgi:outer membrane protein assembly factor BamB